MILYPENLPLDYDCLRWTPASQAIVLLAPHVLAVFTRSPQATIAWLKIGQTPLWETYFGHTLRLPKHLSKADRRGYAYGVVMHDDPARFVNYARNISNKTIQKYIARVGEQYSVRAVHTYYDSTPQR